MPAHRCEAILFDLDGVLVNSVRCVERVWHLWAEARGRDPAPFLAVAHGRRVSETLRTVDPTLDIGAETAALDCLEELETEGLEVIPGADSLVRQIPSDRWAIVTSGSRTVATRRLESAGLPIPAVFVTGEAVRRGKPDPEPYLLAAERLGRSPAGCLVVEDAPAGISSALAAGMAVLAVTTTHASAALRLASFVTPSLDRVSVDLTNGDPIVTWS